MGYLDVADLGAVRSALLMLLTFDHDRRSKARAKVVRQFVELRVAVNLNGFFCGIANHVAVMTPGKMIFQFDLRVLVEGAFQVIG
jgi:hypothetical protein